MPRDVTTQWNLTYDMLEYALKHRKAVNALTQQRDLKLRKLELADDEWAVLKELHNVLQVHTLSGFSEA